MTTRKPNKLWWTLGLCLLGAALSAPAQEEAEPEISDEPAATEAEPAEPATPPAPPRNPRRAASFSEALSEAGDDGVAVFCYGPDWNKRSLRMLKSFWQTPEAEAATGNAILVAVPYYESPTFEQAAESENAASGMNPPPFGVCPTVMLFTKDGTRYANLPGTDFLGTEDSMEIGYKNLREKIAALRKQQELLKQAENASGAEKAKLLSAVADLPIEAPRGLVERIKEADPSDTSGMVRRNTFSALAFLYEQMDTKDGFLKPDFVPDYKKMQDACMKVIKDEALRPMDRQAAYLLLIGQSRREEIPPAKLKGLINACAKIDPQTRYGRLSPPLATNWGNIKHTRTAEEKREIRKKEREQDKARRDKARDEKRAAKGAEVR